LQKQKIKDRIAPECYKIIIDFTALLNADNTLGISLLWPDGELEQLEKYNVTHAHLSTPIFQSLFLDDLLPDESILKELEKAAKSAPLVASKVTLKGNSISCELASGLVIRGQFDSLLAGQTPPHTLSGESAILYLHAIQSYYWAYANFNLKSEWTPEELRRFLLIHPTAKQFRRVQEQILQFLLKKESPTLKKGQRTFEAEIKKINEDYAIFNLIKSITKKGITESEAYEEISEFLQDEFQIGSEFDYALKKAHDRAKKHINVAIKPPKANMLFIIHKKYPIYFANISPQNLLKIF